MNAVTSRDVLTPEQVEAAWRTAYRIALDANPDREVRWEVAIWRAWGADSIATIGEELMAEREAAGLFLTSGNDAASLDKLLSRIDQRAALRLVRDEASCLLDAVRLVYWAGLREAGR